MSPFLPIDQGGYLSSDDTTLSLLKKEKDLLVS
jgi:hypothetical protein